MSLDNPEVLDAIGIDADDGSVVLTIIDGWEWSDEDAHLTALQAKLNAYFGFVESGQIGEFHADWRERRLLLEVLFRIPPPDSALALLKTAEFVARRLEMSVGSRVIGT